jgi:hypothetical protein
MSEVEKLNAQIAKLQDERDSAMSLPPNAALIDWVGCLSRCVAPHPWPHWPSLPRETGHN